MVWRDIKLKAEKLVKQLLQQDWEYIECLILGIPNVSETRENWGISEPFLM